MGVLRIAYVEPDGIRDRMHVVSTVMLAFVAGNNRDKVLEYCDKLDALIGQCDGQLPPGVRYYKDLVTEVRAQF